MKFLSLQNVCPLGIHNIKQVIKADKNVSYTSQEGCWGKGKNYFLQDGLKIILFLVLKEE